MARVNPKGFETIKEHQVEFGGIVSDDELPPIEYVDLENKLSRRQRYYVWFLVNLPRLTKTACAKKAGYKDPMQAILRLNKNPKVQKEIQFLMAATRQKYELNYERAVKDLYDIRDQALAQGSFNAAIMAQNALLKVGGLVVDRKEVKYGKIDQMSRAEVESRLQALLEGKQAQGMLAEAEYKELPGQED
jgi:hypothetical protein|tara:strand:+ start:712 stop:1281 length:570 start_codon:yes stop_codon:yes gene_type:complete